MLIEKFKANMATLYSPEEVDELTALFLDQARLEAMPVTDFMARLAR